MFCLLISMPAWATERQTLHGHVPKAVAGGLQATGRLDGSKNLHLAIGLPLQNQQALTGLLQQLHDPASPNYRKYLSVAQFTDRFGPAEKDYEAVAAFARANGLRVAKRHPNRVVLDLEGAVADIEKAFHVTMRTYPHPKEARTFYAPDAEPSPDLAVPILHIEGLTNYSKPHPNLHRKPVGQAAKATPNIGSEPTTGAYGGSDFRKAYVPGTSLTGAGQSVGLVQFDGYDPNDIAAYKALFKLPNIVVVPVPINGGVSTPGKDSDEVCLDIEMVMSMAPGVSSILVYEAPDEGSWMDVLNQMATGSCMQLSCSWWGTGGDDADPDAEGIFMEMAAQGQSFFTASGDTDSVTGDFPFPCDSPNITQVGGTTLTTDSSGSYVSEKVWNAGANPKFDNPGGEGSSGGISTHYAIPYWQQGISMTHSQGSTTMRNVPDVALTADNIWVLYGSGKSGNFWGTSCAAPLWAAFTALVNEASFGPHYQFRPVGFINPLLYAIGTGIGGKGASYATCFHDITQGNNFNSSNQTLYKAEPGYDLCTGWGTPQGPPLIAALAGLTPLTVDTTGPLASGVAGETYSQTLSASGGDTSYKWTISYGSLPPGLSLNGAGGLSGAAALSGTPTTAGTYNFTIQVTDWVGTTAIFNSSITIQPQLVLQGTAGLVFNQAIIPNTGVAPYTNWSIVGNLPPGLTLSGSGVVTGTPDYAATRYFTIRWTDSKGTPGTWDMSMIVQDLPFTYASDGNGHVYITSYIGSGGVVNIPDTIYGAPVISISANAFYHCTCVTSVTMTMPSNVTYIGPGAFTGCNALTSVTIPNSVIQISNNAFQGCTSLASLAIPASVTGIAGNAFYDCPGLKYITVDPQNPNYSSASGVLFNKSGTTLIQYPGSTPITTYAIPSSVTSIATYAFSFSNVLSRLEIPSTVTSIESYAFYACPNLAVVTIASGVTSIPEGAFYVCTGLKSVTIPASVTSIGSYAFYGCTSLLASTGMYPAGVTSIGRYAFYGCASLDGFTIPSGVTSIADHTFDGCAGLTLVTIFSGVTSIADYAFHGCTGLTSVTIPSNVTSIGSYAFSGCTGLTAVTIPAAVASMGNNAFSGCGGLGTAYFMGNAPTMGTGVFDSAAGGFTVFDFNNATGFTPPVWLGYLCVNLGYTTASGAITITNCTGSGGALNIPAAINGLPVTGIGSSAFSGVNLTGVTIPSSVTSIAAGAFSGSANLTSITVAAANTFYSNVNGVLFNKNQTTLIQCPGGMTGIGSYTIPASVTSIANQAFAGCAKLPGITIPSSVTSIGADAFQGCAGLTGVTIPVSVISIGGGAFSGCSHLTAITMAAPNSNYSSVNGVLFNGNQTTLIQCPGGMAASYGIPGSVNSIASEAFSGCAKLPGVTILSSVTSIRHPDPSGN